MARKRYPLLLSDWEREMLDDLAAWNRCLPSEWLRDAIKFAHREQKEAGAASTARPQDSDHQKDSPS